MGSQACAPGSPGVRFGTSGWRGVVGRDFTLPRLRAVLHGVARWVSAARDAPRVVVARDTRRHGERMVDLAAAVLGEYGIEPLVSQAPVPTPVASHAVTRRRAAAGIVFTASHNPAEYHGVKVIGPGGGAIGDADAREVEAASQGVVDGPEVPSWSGRRQDFVTPYAEELAGLLDAEALAGAKLDVVYDAMHGAGGGVLEPILTGLGVRVRGLRQSPDPDFGGAAPDPGPEQLGDLSEAVRRGEGLRLGLATDGDADRYGVVDANGSALSESQSMALLVDHVARSGRVRSGFATSVGAGSLAERVAAHHGLAVSSHPVGFKHLARCLEDGRADVAGDESGGFALAALGADKDGLLASCLLAELVAVTDSPLGERLAALEHDHGPCAWGRTSVSAGPEARERLSELAAAPPERVGGAQVTRVDCDDGLRLALSDGFLMLRASGTEPLIRVYGEAPDARALARRIAAGVAWLEG